MSKLAELVLLLEPFPEHQAAFDALATQVDEEMSRLVLGRIVQCGCCGLIQCGCCGLTYAPWAWEKLELVGRIDDRDEGGELLEQRNCTCGSTMTKELEP